MSRWLGDQRGQSTVEIVALMPLLAVVAMALLQLLAAGMAAELADHAAEAGAVAMLQRRDPKDAVHDALPRWSRERMEVAVRGHRVRVKLRPPAPSAGLAEALATTVEADAGPEGR